MFRLVNVNGRAALEKDGSWHDLATLAGDDALADPFELNRRLGTYTNFVNLLDLSALAVPAAMLPDGTPFGVTFVARAGDDAMLAAIGLRFHGDTGLAPGKP